MLPPPTESPPAPERTRPRRRGDMASHRCRRDGAKAAFLSAGTFPRCSPAWRSASASPTPRTMHPREHPDPQQPPGSHRPPRSRTVGSDTGTPLAPRPLQQLRVPALPRGTLQPPTSAAPTRPYSAGTEPAWQGSAKAPWAKLGFCQGKLPVPTGNSPFPPGELVSLVPPWLSHGVNTLAAGSRLRDEDPLVARSLKPP